MESLERIEKILAILEVSPQGLSGQELADVCGVPWLTMQEDLQALDAGDAWVPLYSDHDESDDEIGEDIFQPQVKWFLQKGYERYSLVRLNICEALGALNALEFLPEKSLDKSRLKEKILTGFDLARQESYRLVKGNMSPLQPIPEGFPLIEAAIIKENKLQVQWNDRTLKVEPLGLIYYSKLRHWYLVAREQGVIKNYNLANIKEMELLSEEFAYPDGFSLKEWFKYRWGTEYGEPIQVKVKFLDRSQTIAKVKKDVAHRTSRLTIQNNGSLLFEDTIIGENEFIAWILGFGSTAEVLEPIEMRQAIRERIREALARY